MSTQTETKPKNGAIVKAASSELSPATISENFVKRVEKQFIAEMGSPLHWTSLQKALAQHLYIKVDSALRALEVKRASNSRKASDPPITWENVNMQKLAIDAVNRVSLELDALISNHIHVIPYLNSRTKQYDVDLRIGYMGKDHIHRKFAIDPPLEIRYQLVHETDTFNHGYENGIACYSFKQANPFNPGEVIGGFGYIAYEDPRKNRVVIVEFREFEKAMKASHGVEFWGGEQTAWENGKPVKGEYDEKFRKEMQFKTVVHRVTSKIALDPAKVNIAAIEESMADLALIASNNEASEHANAEVIDVTPEPQALEQTATTQPATQPQPEPEKVEATEGLEF